MSGKGRGVTDRRKKKLKTATTRRREGGNGGTPDVRASLPSAAGSARFVHRERGYRATQKTKTEKRHGAPLRLLVLQVDLLAALRRFLAAFLSVAATLRASSLLYIILIGLLHSRLVLLQLVLRRY